MTRIGNKKLRAVWTAFFIAVIIAAAPFFPATVYAEAVTAERNTLIVTCSGKRFVYTDEITPPPNHLVAGEFFEHRVNHSPEDKAAYTAALTRAGYGKKKALLIAYPGLEAFFAQIAAYAYREPVNGELKFYPGKNPRFEISSARSGVKADEKSFYAQVYALWQNSVSGELVMPLVRIPPAVTEKDCERLTCLRGEFSTDYSRSGSGRKHNIELAMRALDGVRIKNGEKFSFNAAVGPRTAQRGYEQAKIIVGGKYVDGVGGGVCQVSTTLYNAALYAGMYIEEAHGHSLAPSYVEPSFDAAVNSGSMDLKFTNSTGGDVFISAYCAENRAVVRFYGLENGYEIRRRSVVTARGAVPEDEIIEDAEGKYFPPDSESGELVRIKGGIAGLDSEGYLDFYRNGKKVFSRRIRRDKYAPVRGILAKKP